jgi:molybdopterin converting factor subunit 1
VVPIKVRVRYFAAHKDLVGITDETVEVPDGTTVEELVQVLVGMHPTLAELRRDTMVSVNRGVGSGDIVLKDGDDVALFPPIQGG